MSCTLPPLEALLDAAGKGDTARVAGILDDYPDIVRSIACAKSCARIHRSPEPRLSREDGDHEV